MCRTCYAIQLYKAVNVCARSHGSSTARAHTQLPGAGPLGPLALGCRLPTCAPWRLLPPRVPRVERKERYVVLCTWIY